MYHDFLGREIEDLEGENMRHDWIDGLQEEQKKNRLQRIFQQIRSRLQQLKGDSFDPFLDDDI